ncbi:uncharacterized protein DS421_9g267620 [Arachis hypogaea]|nr:uncharacterized protein DS421_9g267620 [Arachis hypogaea]
MHPSLALVATLPPNTPLEAGVGNVLEPSSRLHSCCLVLSLNTLMFPGVGNVGGDPRLGAFQAFLPGVASKHSNEVARWQRARAPSWPKFF